MQVTTTIRRRSVVLTALVALALLAPARVEQAAASAPAPDATPTTAPALTPQTFANPPSAYRPKTRWWWATPYDAAEFAAEIEAIADAGFGGVEVAFNEEGWATPSQREALRSALAAARQHDISLDMTMGAAWPVRSPAVDKATGLSEQELQYGRRDLVGPSLYTGPPPGPMDGTPGTRYAVTAARVTTPGPPVAAPLPGPNLTPTGPTAAPAASTVLDPDSLVDLTDAVDADGNLTWRVPEGHWILFGFWQRPASENVMDHFNRDSAGAVVDYIDEHMLGDTAAALPGVGGSFFEDSLELDVAELMWTGRFAAEFRQRRGYDVRKYLPLLFIQGAHHYPVWERMPNPDFDLPDHAGDRIRHDYFQTLTDLYVHEHIVPFQRWAESHGMRFRTQAAFGAALDVTRSAREVAKAGGIADDESLNAGDPATLADSNWRFAMDHYRSVVGGVHQGGGREISSELGAMFWREYQPGLADLKAIMDKQWAAGITTPILHGFAYQPPGAAWPGRSQFFGIVSDSWNHRHFPQWSMWRPLTDYWARGNLVLQQGRPQVDVAVYRDGFVTSAATFWALATDAANHQVDPALPARVLTTPEGQERIDDSAQVKPRQLFDGESLERAGYTFEYIDPQGLLEPAAAGDGVLYPDGPAYRALVIDERALPAATAEAIAREAAKGLRVVFVGSLPDRGAGHTAPADEDARVRAAVQRMLDLPTVRRVDTQAGVRAALADAQVEPAARWSSPAPVYSAHRRGDGVDYWYLWNAGDSAVRVDGSFATRGAPSALDLWTGEIRPLGHHRTEGDRVVVPLRMAPGETTVLAFRHGQRPPVHAVATDAEQVIADSGGLEVRDTRPGTREVRLSDGSRRQVTMPDLPDPLTPDTWSLHVDEVGPNGVTGHDLELTQLRDWRDIEEISDASGAGRYAARVSVPEDWVGGRRGTYLDLGTVHGAIQVRVNGQRVAPDSVAGRRFDISGHLRPGENELTIQVTTTLKNRLAGLAREGSPRPATMAAQPATQPYGLLGPVRLIPFARARLGSARPDLTVTGVTATQDKPKQTVLTASVANRGEADADGVVVEFRDGGTVLGRSATAALAAGASTEVSVTWDTRGVKGEHSITAVVDPEDTIAESDEANNSLRRTVTIRGNKVSNGSFESASGGSPDGWSGGEGTSYDTSGGYASDGAAAAGVTGSGALAPAWTSAPVPVAPGQSYDLAMTVTTRDAVSPPSLTVSYLDSSGAVLGAVTGVDATLAGDATDRQLLGRVHVPAGASAVRLSLSGSARNDLAPQGVVWFDDIWMW